MNYYNNEEEYGKRGIDWDLGSCLEFNPQDGFDIDSIDEVLAVYEGENDGEDWRWVLQLKDGRFVYLQGGCDYTGWDCRSSADHRICQTPLECAKQNDIGWREGEQPEVNVKLISQLVSGKDKTWREQMDDIFPDVPKIES